MKKFYCCPKSNDPTVPTPQQQQHLQELTSEGLSEAKVHENPMRVERKKKDVVVEENVAVTVTTGNEDGELMNWDVHLDPATGKHYRVHRITRVTEWT